jgi:hypothetical protein
MDVYMMMSMQGRTPQRTMSSTGGRLLWSAVRA